MDIEKLLKLSREACASAASAGAQDADAIVVDGRSVSVEIEKNSISSCDVEYDAGYGARAFHHGGVGFSRGRGLDASDAKAAGTDAAAMSREAQPDPDFIALPQPPGAANAYAQIGGMFDEKVEQVELPAVIEWGLRCVEAARAIEPDVLVKCGAGATALGYALANTRGIASAERATFVSFYVFSVVRRGDDVGSFYDYTQGRRLEDLKTPEEVAREATERAVSFLGARKIESGKFPTLLGPLAAGSFIRSVIGPSSAEEIQRGRSYLAEKRGSSIASERLTVTEDPLLDAGLYSSAFDGEGVPRRRSNLIDKGVLTSYLHNSYTANKAKEENNGHAARGSYNSDVGISASNLTVTPGGKTEAELIRGISDGLYIYAASLSPNSVTGQISGTVDHGYRIINGEFAYPVQNVMLGGDVFEFLNSIEEITSDFRVERGNNMPSILLGGVTVAGSA
ncbi:MAG: TldD/PmbA family protein [bacterium]